MTNTAETLNNGGDTVGKTTTVHVLNLSSNKNEGDIWKYFNFCGKIDSIEITAAASEKGSSPSATITFDSEGAADTAVRMDHPEIKGSKIQVTSAHSREQCKQFVEDVIPDLLQAVAEKQEKKPDEVEKIEENAATGTQSAAFGQGEKSEGVGKVNVEIVDATEKKA